MVLRLTVDTDERLERFDLEPGEHVLGSASDCDVRIVHPVVSRHHARLVVSNDAVTLEDLSSSNGTRAGTERIRGRARELELPAELSFGTVTGRLEALTEGDTAAAISFAFPAEPVAAESRPEEGTRTTAGLGSSLKFVAAELPQLLRRLVAGDDEAAFLAALGAALFESVPCAALRIADAAGGTAFLAERSDVGSEIEVEHGRVTAGFVNPGHARGWASLLEVAAQLAELAARRTAPPAVGERTSRPPPSLPDPQTVVPAVRTLYEQAARLAASDVGIVIVGESGTGKEVLARYVHAASRRREGPFVALNCAALPGDLLESELFGVARGAATGVTERPGRFESAHGGTLFLDEIGDMRLETQAKILRALEEKEVYRLGASEPRPADVRVLAATNRDLDAMVADGRFRRDVYHRIADWRAELPPLHRRRADIPNLAAFFLRRECDRAGVAGAGISRAALDALTGHDWPGNVRELEREMARAAHLLGDGQLLERGHLRREIVDGARLPRRGTLEERVAEAERRAIRDALDESTDIATAAEALGVSRATLYRRIKKLGLDDG